MAEAFVGRDPVTYKLFQFLDIGKSPGVFSRKNYRTVNLDLEHATCPGSQGDALDVLFEGCEKLLRHPRGAQHPPALGEICDMDSRLH
jgi:hypothetical protein